MRANIEPSAMVESDKSSHSAGDYAELLQSFGLEYRQVEYYLQVGQINQTQGWILHLSTVLSQIKSMIITIMPFLVKKGVPFKIAINESTCEDLLNGNLGAGQIGKIVSIYPASDSAAVDLAKHLIQLTQSYKGPVVPTDICLGNIVYTRYGSFNPIIKLDPYGNEAKYIYNEANQLVRDCYSIPFQMPSEVLWPFKEFTEPIVLPIHSKLLNRIYRIVDVLKPDLRGNVFKGLYVKNLFLVKHCVIKQGFSNMGSDKAGRDIQDRLVWQHELYKELSGIVPMPTMYALLKEPGFTVLIMKFIKGSSLYGRLTESNYLSKSWLDLSPAKRSQSLQYATEITNIINKMHKKGYVHRDIVPVNFLIGKNNKIKLIDIELGYSLKANKPYPPFTLGTPGFMSPEQEAIQEPAIEEDIYGLGATLLYIFTEITPVKFNTKDTEVLIQNLTFFIGNKEVATVIANCLNHAPKLRPSIPTISNTLIKYKVELQKTLRPAKGHIHTVSGGILREIISSALEGLTKPPIVVVNNLWYSKQITIENFTAPKNKQFAKSPGLSEGISGVLYMLARVHNIGLSIDTCDNGYRKGWEFLEDKYLSRLPEIPAGLYKGGAGLALALAESIYSGLLKDNELNRNRILNCLSLTTDKVDLANGITGQGVSLLQCQSLLKIEGFQVLLNKIVGDLISRQQKDGSWQRPFNSRQIKKAGLFNMAYDDTGIIWFLLEYLCVYPNIVVRKAVTKAITAMLNDTKYQHAFNKLLASKESYESGDGGKGLVIMLIKAYETFQEERYKKVAEDSLYKFPIRVIHNNFSQVNGLAALGEVYLEAWRAFKNEEWKHRADWIANVFINSFFRADTASGYWIMEQNNPPTADFLTGNSGVIYFLARCLYPDKIGYRLLK